MERSGGAPPPDAARPILWPEISTRAPTTTTTQLAAGDGLLFTIGGALTDEECRALIRAVEDAGGYEWQGSAGPSKGEAARDCGRVSRRGLAEEALASRLWERLGPPIVAGLPARDASRAVGLNPHIRMYAYAPGQKFSRHYDDSEVVSRNKTATGYTLLIYLSTLRGGGTGGGGKSRGKGRGGGKGGGAGAAPPPPPSSTGGETKFYSDGGKLVASVAPVAGTALLHRHGDRCLLHEGAKVEKVAAGGNGSGSGIKYVFRSDVVFDVSESGGWWS